jgi:hypothetical protein
MAQRLVPATEVVFLTAHPNRREAVGELPAKALFKPVDLAVLTQEMRSVPAG